MKDPLFSNKVAAAVLTALLLIFGLPQLTAAIFGGGHHGGDHGELHLAYGGDIQLETAGPVEEEPEVDLGTLLANASAAAGERRAAICKSCHTFEQGGAHTTGPNLWNVVGRQVASASGFNYTGALQDFGGTWTYERLDGYLKNSQEYVPGTAMVQRFPRDDQRADLLAYLSTLTSGEPVPFPEPAPAPEETADAGDEAGAPSEETEERASEEAH